MPKLVQGSIVSLDLEAVKKDPLHLKPTVVFAPSQTEFAQDVDTTKNRMLLTTLENVQGRVYTYTFGAEGAWTRKKLDVPENRAVSIVSTNWSDDQFFYRSRGS
jgi:prolyl oligopeptidase